jgi:muramoyltetrapeptide carboxypeptidase
MRRPEPAPPGSLVHIVAPSGPFDEILLRRGMAALGDYEFFHEPTLIGRQTGFLAGDDQTRLSELQRALDSAEARVIWLARGGYGLGRIAHHLDWSAFAVRPKWIVGFSDGTVLHQACLAHGVTSLHGPNVTSLADASQDDVASLRAALAGAPVNVTRGLGCLVPGRAEGPLVGGNLTVLCMQAAAGRLTLPKGAILFLEDVDETSYRVDRMLTALLVGGHLTELSGIVLGQFTNCAPGRFDVPVQAVLRAVLAPLGLPLVDGFPSGHGHPRQTWVHGGLATLDAAAGTLTVSPS